MLQGRRGPRVRYTYAEAEEWQAQLSDEDQAWLAALIEADMVLGQERVLRQAVARLWAGLAEVAGAWGSQQGKTKRRRETKKSRVKAKQRRQRDRARSDDPEA